MASVEKQVRNRRTAWLVRWRDPTGAQRKKSFPPQIRGRPVPGRNGTVTGNRRLHRPAMSRVTVGEWSKTWLAQIQVKPSTATRYEGLLRVHILPTWQRVPLQAVTHVEVGRWVTDLVEKGLAPSTVRQAHRALSLVLSLAVKDNRIARNPAAGVRLPRVSAKQKRFLTQVSSLADAAGQDGLAIQVLAYTGIRFGELAALRVRHIDLVKRRLQVAESVTEVRGQAMFGSPKTHATRPVGIPSFIIDQIATRLAGQPEDAFVFAAPRGGVLRLRNWRRQVFDPAAAAAGLDGITPHDLRHTAASLPIAADANSKPYNGCSDTSPPP